ncbi:adenine glycosylase [Eggerthellaceae bacterium zg-997]|nr:adenine glycosylase [Eggerthellaceae bacterium zg-997]
MASAKGAAPAPPCWDDATLSRAQLIERVWSEGGARYRDLPWRNIDDPYAVLVSEVMLQQTQVARVERYWTRFLGRFPTVDALASASASDVLEMWQGLGYNRRALALKRAADACAAHHGGTLPRDLDQLLALPGVGPATAAGVRAFAFQLPGVYIETNVRTVFLHELFPQHQKVADRTLEPFVRDTCPLGRAVGGEGAASPDVRDDPRAWYYALLDYGAYLKSQVQNPSRRSAHYARQSSFEGSHRQKRSFALRLVLDAPEGLSVAEVAMALDAFEQQQGRPAPGLDFASKLVDQLTGEGFFLVDDGLVRPA